MCFFATKLLLFFFLFESINFKLKMGVMVETRRVSIVKKKKKHNIDNSRQYVTSVIPHVCCYRTAKDDNDDFPYELSSWCFPFF